MVRVRAGRYAAGMAAPVFDPDISRHQTVALQRL